MNCKCCARTIPDDAVVCCYCGEKVLSTARWRCPHCGAEFEGDRVYCDQCGMSLARVAEEEPAGDARKDLGGKGREKKLPPSSHKHGKKRGLLIVAVAAAVCCAILLLLVLWMAGVINW